MPSVNETAYPRLRSNPSAKELKEVYTPTASELDWASEHTNAPIPRLGLLVMLKAFQRLGYFVMCNEVPPAIVEHIAQSSGFSRVPDRIADADAKSVRNRQMKLVLEYLNVKAWSETARQVMEKACRDGSRTHDDLPDIINVAIEELVRQRFELPAFSTLVRASQTARTKVNHDYHALVCRRLTDPVQEKLRQFFKKEPGKRSSWNRLKAEPKRATVQHTKDFLKHLNWLQSHGVTSDVFDGVPDAKIKHFAAEGRSFDLATLNECLEQKRLTLVAALIVVQIARAFDDSADMFIRLVQKLHNHGRGALITDQSENAGRTDRLISTLRNVTLAYRTEGTAKQRLAAIGKWIDPAVDKILEDCDAHEATADHNYLPFLLRFYKHQRSALLAFLDTVPLVSTSPDKSLSDAIVFLLAHKSNTRDFLSILLPTGTKLDLSFVSERWWPLVTGKKTMHAEVDQVNRRYFEICVVTQVMQEMKSGDLCIPESDAYSDYRDQLVDDKELGESLASYEERAGVPTDPTLFTTALRQELEKVAKKTDENFPENEYLHIENGEPVLKRLRRKPDPDGLQEFENQIKQRMKKSGILDVLFDTEQWLNWTKNFGPISGHDPKIQDPVHRYIVTVFCYGFALGPMQTSRSIRGLDRKQPAYVNQRHITVEKLSEAITEVNDGYNEFDLPKAWGFGKSASADGTKWDINPQNFMSEYHIRYGGYGGLGLYLVSDMYIALVSRFTTCGAWEGHHILDFVIENASDIQPDTIHADTQGQSTAIFGLAHILGIKLQPRIRNWKHLVFYRPDPNIRYEHIDVLFSEGIDWQLIESMVPEMLRVAVSIGAGRIKPSTILRRLATYSRKNKLYFAFRELGRVVRTIFLLSYISDIDLRRTIQVATNKSEAFNRFVQWVSFGGGGLITENVREEQRKMIKYSHLVSNLIIFHNVVSMTKALQKMESEKIPINEEALLCISPFLTEHINRFGRYRLKPRRKPAEPLDQLKNYKKRKPEGV